jgi:hypothetical protein
VRTPVAHLLVDGTLAILRPLVPDEPERVQEVFDELSDPSRYLRFHAVVAMIGTRAVATRAQAPAPDTRASSSSTRPRSPGGRTTSAAGSAPETQRPSRATAPAGPLAQQEPSDGHCTASYAVSSNARQWRPPS